MLLALDTSTQWVGVAVVDESQIVAEMTWRTQNHHTVEIAPAIDSLLKRCGVAPTALKALGVALGPGSFTSLRIGLAVAKGMALALKIPLVGVPTLDVLAAMQPVRELPLVTVLQAGRNRLAVGWYAAHRGAWQPQGDVAVMTIDQLSEKIETPTLVCGELESADRQTLGKKRKLALLASPAQSLRRPSYLGEIAYRRWQTGQVDDVVSLAPIYLHVAEAIPG